MRVKDFEEESSEESYPFDLEVEEAPVRGSRLGRLGRYLIGFICLFMVAVVVWVASLMYFEKGETGGPRGTSGTINRQPVLSIRPSEGTTIPNTDPAITSGVQKQPAEGLAPTNRAPSEESKVSFEEMLRDREKQEEERIRKLLRQQYQNRLAEESKPKPVLQDERPSLNNRAEYEAARRRTSSQSVPRRRR